MNLLDKILDSLRRRPDHNVELEDLIALADRLNEDLTRDPEPRPRGSKRTRRTVSPEDCWTPAGREVTVAGYRIPDGLIYVGQGLRAVNGYSGPDPALIDPELPVDRQPGVGPTPFGYYHTSYAQLHPSDRAAYLAWLAGGRRDPRVRLSFVYLYFYGLERRLVADTKHSESAWSDADAIVAEVKRLVETYGNTGSFRQTAANFLQAVSLLRDPSTRVYDVPPDIPVRNYELSLALKIGLGQLSLDRKPVPAQWALAWLRAHPEAHMRTAADRCRKEFDRLFLLRYPELYGEGFTVRPSKRRLWASYYPSSPGLNQVTLPVKEVPDVAELIGPLRKLTEVADVCYQELDAYSRWVGRRPDDRKSLQAQALLPAPLLDDEAGEALAEFSAGLEALLGNRDMVMINAEKLIEIWAVDAPSKLSKAEAVALGELLMKRGYGLEPDVRFGGPVLSPGPVVLFKDPTSSPPVRLTKYHAGRVLAQLSLAVGGIGGVTEPQRRYILSHLPALAPVGPVLQRRLEAHLEWRLATGASLSGVKSRLGILPPQDRPAVGKFLVGVAAADGTVSPDEITFLSKVYRLLELPPGDVYSDVHSASLAPAALAPVTVRPAKRARNGYTIPPEPPSERTLTLDSAQVEAKLADSARASALLEAIFADDDVAPTQSADHQPADVAPAGASGIMGLDSAHSSLLRALSEQPVWSRAELLALAAEQGLLPDGAVDAINEAAIEALGEPLLEGDDPIEITTDLLKELSA